MQKEAITRRQKEVLRTIYNSLITAGFPPSFSELKEKLDVSSNQTILDIFSILEKKNLISREEGSARGIKILKRGYRAISVRPLAPVVGFTSAGNFTEAIEEIDAWQPLSKDVETIADDVMIVRVMGDSMINAGIEDGDLILFKKTSEFVSGDIVLAQTLDGTTVKRFISQDKPPYVFLKPENPKYKNIPFSDEMKIIGKMIKKNNATPERNKNITAVISKPYFKGRNILIYKDDILKINSIPENSVDLIITSPPYNIDIHYNSHADNLTYKDYLEFTKKWIQKCYELAKDDCRFCLNIPLDKNKGGQQSVGADITKIAKEIGWKYHSTIIWNEGNISRRTAWGSYKSASAPYVIAPVELILVLYKNNWKKLGGSRKNDITKEEFIQWTNGVWTFNGESKKRVGHPAPFPVELPRRCIKLFSFIGDTVLDPFFGSGTTIIASYLNNRKGIGVDIDKAYCDLAIKRLKQEVKINQLKLT